MIIVSANLLEILDDWTLAINDRASIITAFDVVCHNKLAFYAIAENLLNWIKNFLSWITGRDAKNAKIEKAPTKCKGGKCRTRKCEKMKHTEHHES